MNLAISTILRSIQFLALGTWLGSILYFSCAVAPARARALRPAQAQQTQEGSSHDQRSENETEPPGTDPDWRKGLLRMANGVTKDGFAFSQNTYRGTTVKMSISKFFIIDPRRARRTNLIPV